MNCTRLPNLITIGRDLCGDLDQAERREWWLGNGLGAYAAGTVAGSLTRRYHGLLVAPLTPPLGRRLVLAKADATLVDEDGGREWPLHTNRWADGSVSPVGHLNIEEFRLDGRMPVWRFACADLIVEQRIWMEPLENTTWVAFRLIAGHRERALRVRLAILVNDRDHHHVSVPGSFSPSVDVEGDRLALSYDDGHWLQLIPVGGAVRPAPPAWFEHFGLPLEQYRGLESSDSHLRIGFAELTLSRDSWCGLAATLADAPETDLECSLEYFHRNDKALLQRARQARPERSDAPPWIDQLVLAADTFVFERQLPTGAEGESVIAGYPWFGDWGRDTMIALPGLTLATGRTATARRILDTFAGFVDRGMLPNDFPGNGGEASYNSVDAALWYIEAWRAYAASITEPGNLLNVFVVLESIIDHYRDGTRFGIRMDPQDGLIEAGEPGLQLTWMDAKVGDWVVTPRQGKPVEINALWYNALCTMADFASELGRNPSRYRRLAARTREGFSRFHRGQGLGLYDLLDGPEGDDAAIRPNQILAVSLHHSPLDPEMQAGVVAECGRKLLCSFGLRTLDPDHADYRGHYGGDVHRRDSAYHQGTVWAWMLGHFALAEYRVFGNTETALARLAPIADHLADAGLGTVSEIFDGDPPHRPRGAPAQAWSVACVLDAWWRLQREERHLGTPPDQRRMRAKALEAEKRRTHAT